MSGQASLIRTIALWAAGLGSLAFAGVSITHAVIVPMTTDFAGFDAALHAQTNHLGCVYSRSVQLAGARMVPGLAAPAAPSGLPWHFNEPMVLTYLAYPLMHLPLREAVVAWILISAAALGGGGLLLWRRLCPVSRLLAFAVITSLLCNAVADINFWLAQNDALLLLVLLCGLELLRRGRDIGAGALLGVVALKPQLLFLVLLMLVFQRRWRIVTAACGSAAVLWSVGVAMIGSSCAVTYLHSASALDELQIGIGLPTALAQLTGTAFPAEILFAGLCLGAAGILWRLRDIELELAISVALGCALVIGLHTLWYDTLFLAPLGIRFSRRFPLAVIGAGWLFTTAQVADEIMKLDFSAPVRTVGLWIFAVFSAAAITICHAQRHSEQAPSLVGWLS